MTSEVRDGHRGTGLHAVVPSSAAGASKPAAATMAIAALALAMLAASCGDGGTSTQVDPPATANQPPVPTFFADATEGEAPLSVTFDASDSADPDGEVTSYAWEFGDGEVGTGALITHVYESPGYFVPRLTVTDDRGAESAAVDSALIVTAPPGQGEGTISGVVWHDREGDGARAPGDPGVAGAVVFIDLDEDGRRDAGEPYTVTNRDGEYGFYGVETDAPSSVTQELGLGWTNTSAAGAEGAASHPNSGISTVIGGSVTAEGDYPFMVALLFASEPSNASAFTCGGTIITARWVLTAAHCVSGGQASDFEVLVGTNSLASGGERIPVRTVRVYPAFGADSFAGDDVALLELDRSFMIPRSIPQTGAHPHLSSAGTSAFAIGWGRTLLGGPISTDLREVELPLISNGECRQMLDEEVVETTICAGVQGTQQSICNGDSGGPLIVRSGERWIQVGVTSFGRNCQPPMAFARLSEFVSWIESRIPRELSMSVEVDWGEGVVAEVDFGNFR